MVSTGRRAVPYRGDAAPPGAAGTSATMMTLAVVALALPAVFATGPHGSRGSGVELTSVGVALVLLVLYGLYVLYTVALPAGGAGRGPGPEEERPWTVPAALGVLGAATAGAAAMSEVLVRSVEPVAGSLGLTELFLGFIVVPLVGNAAEHWAAVQAAVADKMDLTFSIAVGSSLQVALFVAPVLVFVSLLMGHRLQFAFNPYELAALVGAVAVANLISLDGESNWVEGAQLLAVYLIVAIGFFFLS